MPNHNNKGNNNTNKGKGTFKNVNHVYDHVVASLDDYCATTIIKGAYANYGFTTRGDKVTIAGSS